MKDVTFSIPPTIDQMLDMAANLKEKYNAASCITASCWMHTTDENPNIARYSIFVDRLDVYQQFGDWRSAFDYYMSLMGVVNEQ